MIPNIPLDINIGLQDLAQQLEKREKQNRLLKLAAPACMVGMLFGGPYVIGRPSKSREY